MNVILHKKIRKILELRELEDTIEKYIEDNNYNINYSIEGCMLFCAYPEIEQEMNCLTAFDKEYYGCRAGKSKAEIYKDGRMLPCILFENINATYQKVNGENFQECWDNDPVFNIINKNKVNNKKCDLCGFSEICNGGCPADRIKKYGVNYNKDIICKK